MSRTFTTMKTNVGAMVQDTSTTFATIIGVFLNDRYRDVWNRMSWSAKVDDDYTFESVVDQQLYDLPNDFKDEIYMINIATGRPLGRKIIPQWWRDRGENYSSDALDSGTSSAYVILREAINSSGVPLGVIKLDPPPDTAETFGMPYERKFVELLGTTGTCTTDTASKIIASGSTFITSGVEPGMRVKNTTDTTYGYVASVDSETQLTMDSDLCPDGDEEFIISNEPLILDIENILHDGAMADALFYKKQYQKGDYWLQRYDQSLNIRVGQERTKLNQRYQRVPDKRDNGKIMRLTGDKSYDSI